MVWLVLISAILAVVAAAPSRQAASGHAFQRRQLTPQCQSVCQFLSTDLAPCDAQAPSACLCTPAAREDFTSCIQCDPALLAEFNATSVAQAETMLTSMCEEASSSGGLPPSTTTASSSTTASASATSSSSAAFPTSGSGAACCTAWAADIQPCDIDNLAPCTCSPQQQQDFLLCITCDPQLLAQLNVTNTQDAVTALQLYCGPLASGSRSETFPTASATRPPPSTSSGGISGIPGSPSLASRLNTGNAALIILAVLTTAFFTAI